MYKITLEESQDNEFNEDLVFQTEKIDEKDMKMFSDQQERMKILKEEELKNK